MMRGWIVALGLIGCTGTPDFRVTDTAYVYEINTPAWSVASPQLRAPRAGHSVIVDTPETPGRFFVIGGDVGTATASTIAEPTLDIERCEIDSAECTVVGQLRKRVEQATVLRNYFDGSIVISDGQSLQQFEPMTGVVHDLGGSAQQIVTTPYGILLLGLAGHPESNALFGIRTEGLKAIPAPPFEPVLAFRTSNSAMVISRAGCARFDVPTKTWTALPPLPITGSNMTGLELGPLVIIDGGRATFRFESSSETWRAIAAPAKVDRVEHLVPVFGGAMLLADDGKSQLFSSLTETWMPGPADLPWSVLNAVAPLDEEHVISIGGSELDFIEARTSAE